MIDGDKREELLRKVHIHIGSANSWNYRQVFENIMIRGHGWLDGRGGCIYHVYRVKTAYRSSSAAVPLLLLLPLRIDRGIAAQFIHKQPPSSDRSVVVDKTTRISIPTYLLHTLHCIWHGQPRVDCGKGEKGGPVHSKIVACMLGFWSLLFPHIHSTEDADQDHKIMNETAACESEECSERVQENENKWNKLTSRTSLIKRVHDGEYNGNNNNICLRFLAAPSALLTPQQLLNGMEPVCLLAAAALPFLRPDIRFNFHTVREEERWFGNDYHPQHAIWQTTTPLECLPATEMPPPILAVFNECI